jgi:membrane-associated phospholipid phosphatase
MHRLALPRRQWLAVSAAGALAGFCLAAALRILAAKDFDYPLILSLNAFARRSGGVDHAMQALANFDLFQGLPIVALACGAAAAAFNGRERVRVAIGVLAASGAALLSRLAQYLLPNLPRPTVDHALAFRRPYGGSPDWWRDWSSFPSDHATLLWGIAFATLLIDRRLGALSMVVAGLSSLARLYCGLHFATDILGGMLLGIAIVSAVIAVALPWEERLLAFSARRPALIAIAAFLIGAQAATFFYDLRAIAEVAARNVEEIGTAPTDPRQAARGEPAPSPGELAPRS